MTRREFHVCAAFGEVYAGGHRRMNGRADKQDLRRTEPENVLNAGRWYTLEKPCQSGINLPEAAQCGGDQKSCKGPIARLKACSGAIKCVVDCAVLAQNAREQRQRRKPRVGPSILRAILSPAMLAYFGIHV